MSQPGLVILPKLEMCPISQLQPNERLDKRENSAESRNNRGVSAAWGLSLVPVQGVPVRLADKHGDHVTGWLHHPDHPLTQQCRVGVLKVAYAKVTMCDGPAYHAPSDKGAPPLSGICLAPEKTPHSPL